MMERLKSGICRDFLLSLLASCIVTGSAQLLTYPLLAKVCSVEDYGLILTVMGIGNVIIVAFGNSLNNVRLVVNSIYEEKNLKGDFLLVLFVLTIAGTASFSMYLIIFTNYPLEIILLLIGFVISGILYNYGSVAYRIKIDYKKNFLLSIVSAIGSIIGIFLLYFTKHMQFWPLTFFLGQLLGVLYIFFSTDIFEEPIKKTNLFNFTIKKESILLMTTLSANILVYLDRLLLYPLLGGEAVSVYTVASFFGKCLAILMNPISGVLLSYYAQKNYKMNIKRFWTSNFFVLVLAGGFILVCLVVSDWGTSLFYPDLIDKARPFLIIANIVAVINVVGNMTQPAVLKFAPTRWVAIVQFTYMLIYLGMGVILGKTSGLKGFTYAALIASSLRTAMFYIVGHVSLKGQNINGK